MALRLVSVLAYAGLRPDEALALTGAMCASGRCSSSAPSRSPRSLLAPLAADLAEWRLALGRPHESELVFPTRDGRAWTGEHWRKWRKRVFAPAVGTAGRERLRPYDLRHWFVSLLLAERMSLLEVPRRPATRRRWRLRPTAT